MLKALTLLFFWQQAPLCKILRTGVPGQGLSAGSDVFPVAHPSGSDWAQQSRASGVLSSFMHSCVLGSFL